MWEAARQRLLKMQEEIEERVRGLEQEIRRSGEALAADWEEQATQKENDEVIDALDEHGLRELAMIDRALKRIESGHYDECAKCGEAIGKPRLEVVPETIWCVNCAE